MAHASVLLKESLDGLELQKEDIYLDATAGSGGHMEEVWKRMGESVTILGIDADETSVAISKERLDLVGAKAKLIQLNFRNLGEVPELFGVRPTKILFDLGWSSDQFEESGKGFSFQRDEPLVMTFGTPKEGDTTAHDVVNRWNEESLADIIYGFGEEKYARRIAKAIVEARGKSSIETSLQLSEIVKSAVPIFYKFGRLHSATKTFQAIRIAVNDELQALSEGLQKGFEILEHGGRIAVISFHSLEDRIVKNFFKLKKAEGRAEIINKKPIVPTLEEITKNPRSRSAKLRVIKKQ